MRLLAFAFGAMFLMGVSGAQAVRAEKVASSEVEQIIKRMTFEEKVGQLLFVGFGGTEMDETISAFFKSKKPGGAAFFSRNIKRGQRRTRIFYIHHPFPRFHFQEKIV